MCINYTHPSAAWVPHLNGGVIMCVECETLYYNIWEKKLINQISMKCGHADKYPDKSSDDSC